MIVYVDKVLQPVPVVDVTTTPGDPVTYFAAVTDYNFTVSNQYTVFSKIEAPMSI